MPSILSGTRVRPAVIVTVVVVTVAALAVAAFFVLGGRITIRTFGEGPLDAGVDRSITLPLRAQDKGAAWGDLIMTNQSSGSSLTLDSVAFESTTGTLQQITSPYVWDITGAGSLAAYQLPLPATWTRIPKHPFRGYVLKSEAAKTGADTPEAEVIFEFGVPEKASGFKAVTVSYHIGAVSYRKTFNISFTLCPLTDKAPCS